MFDIDLIFKDGRAKETFVGIDKKEIEVVIDYFNNHQGIPVKKVVEDRRGFAQDYYQNDIAFGGPDQGGLAPDEDTEDDGDFEAPAEGMDSEDDEDFKLPEGLAPMDEEEKL